MVRKGKSGPLHLRQIKHFLETGTYLTSVQVMERNGIRKAARSFLIEDKFYYTGPEGNERRLVLITDEEKAKAFQECHSVQKSEEHYGRTRTLARLREKYYWTSMVEDTVAMIVQCKVCEINKYNGLGHYIRVTEPWEVVSIDILGQFTVTDSGYVFVAVIIDLFSKYTLTVPLRDTTVSDIASAIETCVYQQGSPRKFVTDQTEEFVRELNEVLEIDKGLAKNVLPVTKLQMNRPDEAHIKSLILKHCQSNTSIWSELLQKKVYEINTTFTTSCGHVPFYLMFHRIPNSVEHLNKGNFYTNPTIVISDIKKYQEERSKKVQNLYLDLLSDESAQAEHSGKAGNETKDHDVDKLTSTDLFHIKQVGDHGYQRISQNMPNISSVDRSDSNCTPSGRIKDEDIMQNCEASVYEMGDGEGQVVVVTDGIGGSGERPDMTSQHMVIVQPGLSDQSLIMLSSEHFSNYDMES